MKRIITLASFILALPAGLTHSIAYASDLFANQNLYDECKLLQYRDGDLKKAANPGEVIKMLSCFSYMQGSFQAHNYAVVNSRKGENCAFEKRNLNSFIDDYIKFSKATDSMTMDKGIVVGMLVDECYCTKDPAPFCPK